MSSTPPSGTPISAKTRVSLTLPQLLWLIGSVSGIVATSLATGYALDKRMSKVEDRVGALEKAVERALGPTAGSSSHISRNP